MRAKRTVAGEEYRRKLVARAREMRSNLTPAELLLWSRLRGDQLGVRFRRQHQLASYIADFYSRAWSLVVELDGDSHDERREYDEKRTYWMNTQRGLRVIRFTNDEVLTTIDAVLEAIISVGSGTASPSPLPSPRWGEGEMQQNDNL